MIKIAVCDDEEKERSKTKEMCGAYRLGHPEYDIGISTFTSAQELLAHVDQREVFDVMLLDIYMPDMTGMELARIIRNYGEECQIVFLTTSLAHAVEAFSLHAAHYLVKPFTKEQFEDAITKAVKAVEKNKKSQITLKTKDGIQIVRYSDFIYSETKGHLQEIQLDHNRLQVRISCSELYELLLQDNRFFKCGSTYIINLSKIKEITSRSISFENGRQIPMQRRQYRELLTRYTEFSLKGC